MREIQTGREWMKEQLSSHMLLVVHLLGLWATTALHHIFVMHP